MNMPTVDYPVEEWSACIDIDLTGPFLCCRAVAPHMVKAGYGRIVNIASIAGKEGNPNAAAYCAAKARGDLAHQVARQGARADRRAGQLRDAGRGEDRDLRPDDARAHRSYMLSKIPMGRFVKVEEIAALVCWLASEDCSFSTGGVFDISGGRATY